MASYILFFVDVALAACAPCIISETNYGTVLQRTYLNSFRARFPMVPKK